MSPFDMLLFFFFILVTIKAAASSIDYWKDKEADVAIAAREYIAEVRRAAAYKAASGVPVSKMNVRPSAARITPIKRVNAPAANIRSYRADTQCQLNDKGAA